jgi:hypothetical protein
MHLIEIGKFKFKLPAGLRDLKLVDWVFWLYTDFQEDLEALEKRQQFFDYWVSAFSRKMKNAIDQLTEVQLWQVLECLAWLHELKPTAFAPKYRFGMHTYYAVDIEKITLIEFVMAEKVFQEINQKPEKLPELISILYRPKGEKFDWDKCLTRVRHFSTFDKTFQISVLYWFLAVKRQIRNDYEELFEGTEKGDGLGWAGTILSVAESHVFGNLEQTKESNFHEVLLFLVKKHREALRLKEMQRKHGRNH